MSKDKTMDYLPEYLGLTLGHVQEMVMKEVMPGSCINCGSENGHSNYSGEWQCHDCGHSETN